MRLQVTGCCFCSIFDMQFPSIHIQMLFASLLGLVFISLVGALRVPLPNEASRQILPKEIYSMPYKNFKINIYENSNNQDKFHTPSRLKYYYTPIALLDHKSAVSIASYDVKSAEMRFNIDMWNEKVEKEILNYLRGLLGSGMKPHQVQMIPIEEMSLTTGSSATVVKTYSFSNEWLPYHQLQKSLTFSISCAVRNDCDQLAENMRTNPRQFENFKLIMNPTCWNTSYTMDINIIESKDDPCLCPNTITIDEWKQFFTSVADMKKELEGKK